MAKTQTIRRRIRSVKNINQITKAMEMVAASKLRRAQENALRSRMYSSSAREALAYLRLLSKSRDHELFSHRPVTNRLFVVFTSDRGLAGAYNSNILKKLTETLQRYQNNGGVKLIVIGNKGAQFTGRLRTTANIVGTYTNWPAEPSTADLQPIVRTAIKLYRQKSVDSVNIIYTDFVSTIKQEVVIREILPINPAAILPNIKTSGATQPDTLFEPSPAAVLNFIVPRFIETQIYQANLEAIASEQAMRMMSMKNASDNAHDIIDDLTLTFNGARQAAITQELAEISASATAIV
ncbi:MAG: ATP synthase F1 subunit gamma [Candidatus Andersenbacteria bacterium]|nr:ATP synthase F1 subunit gamma [bacterium]MDZ4225435.1 ATP synthase F1 subunit gamma [Candidatus Andersenbacteria bacterium]